MLFPIIVAFVVKQACIIALRPVVKNIDLVDKLGGRKSHVGIVPIISGATMYIGIVIGLAMLPSTPSAFLYLVTTAGLLVAVGPVDDKYVLPASIRLVAQLSAVLIMAYGGGLLIHDIGNPFGFGTIYMGPATLVFTALVILTVVNAFNFIDGVDGLAGSLALVSLAAIAIVGELSVPTTPIVFVVGASILGFLLLNFPSVANRRLRSFMGDAGTKQH